MSSFETIVRFIAKINFKKVAKLWETPAYTGLEIFL
jgi:hypothetical protein